VIEGTLMIVKEDLLKKLRAAFDLNIYEVKIWTALLARGMATAGELSDISQVPRSRSYDVLESLEKKSFVLMKLGRPIRYLAVKPEEIVRRMKDEIQVKADSHVGFLEDVKQDPVFHEIELLYKQGIQKVDPYSLAGSLKGRDTVYNHLRSMLDKAQKSVVMVTSTAGLQRKIKRYKGLFQKLADQGVKIRIAAPLPEGNMKVLNEVKDVVQFKPLEGFKGRFVIIDDQEVMFMVSDDVDVHESYDTGIWVNTPFFTKAFSNMFNAFWNDLQTVKVMKK